MLILLPPSEGKTTPDGAARLNLAKLTRSDLTQARQQVLSALAKTSAAKDALKTLGVGVSLQAQVQANTHLLDAPAAAARHIYTGVLYEAAGLGELDSSQPRAMRRARENARIISALWGALSPADVIPAYRLSMNTSLPGIGKLASFWRQHLGTNILEGSGTNLVIDCRSSAYIAAWKPQPQVTWITVRVVQDRAGVRKVVSHHAKHTRGVLTRHLLTREASLPRTAEDVVDAASELIGTVLAEVNYVNEDKGPNVLELVLAN